MKIQNKLLLLGWVLMLVGLFLPTVTVPSGNPYIGSLVMRIGFKADIAYGWQTALALIALPIYKSSLLLFSLPVWAGLLAPLFLRVKSKIANGLLVMLYGLGFIWPLYVLIFLLKAEAFIEVGFYVWALGFLLLTASRIIALFSSPQLITREVV